MDIIYLQGLTQRGWNKIISNGIEWRINARTEMILFNPEPGPWLFIIPTDQNGNTNKGMWIKEYNDKHFKIVYKK